MKMGIIGTGNMGRTVWLPGAAQGHQMFFGSADREKAQPSLLSLEVVQKQSRTTRRGFWEPGLR